MVAFHLRSADSRPTQRGLGCATDSKLSGLRPSRDRALTVHLREFRARPRGVVDNSSPFCAGSLAEALEGAKVLIDEHLDSIGKAYPSGFRV